METLKLDSSEILKKKIIKNTLDVWPESRKRGATFKLNYQQWKIYQNARSTSCSGGPQID